MTRLPHESRLVLGRPDLPEYELNKACPVTGEVTGLENHHLWPRSFGTKSWWVELPDGTVIGNRVNLSPSAHYRITVNKARIVYDPDGQFPGQFVWIENFEAEPLRWQPPTWDGDPPRTHQEMADAWKYTEEKATPLIVAPAPQEGEECGLCKRRVPHQKKKSSPVTKVFSMRIPIDDAETFSELVDAAAEHMGAKAKPHHVYNTLLVGLTLILQAPKEQLP